MITSIFSSKTSRGTVSDSFDIPFCGTAGSLLRGGGLGRAEICRICLEIRWTNITNNTISPTVSLISPTISPTIYGNSGPTNRKCFFFVGKMTGWCFGTWLLFVDSVGNKKHPNWQAPLDIDMLLKHDKHETITKEEEKVGDIWAFFMAHRP